MAAASDHGLALLFRFSFPRALPSLALRTLTPGNPPPIPGEDLVWETEESSTHTANCTSKTQYVIFAHKL